MLSLLWSCSGYTKKDGKVFLRSSNEANIGVNYSEVENADYETFEVIKHNLNLDLAKDKNFVFLGASILKDADPATFKHIKEYYWKDKSHVYLLQFGKNEDAKIPLADPVTFEVIDNNLWAKDKNNIFYSFNILSKVNNQKFTAIDEEWGKDDSFYYFHEFRLDSLDYKSAKILSSYYIKDKYHVYFENQLVEGCDAASFVVDGAGSFGHDNKNMFTWTENEGPLTEQYINTYIKK
ncbi:MAG: DKNYY domain-containing protein [Bacteroidia bacterium]